VHGTARPTRAAVAAGTRRRGLTSRWRRDGAWDRQHAHQVACSPPCAAPGLLLVDGEATAAGLCSGGGLGFRWRRRTRAKAARVGGPGGAARL
jgi:hypothetical protein